MVVALAVGGTLVSTGCGQAGPGGGSDERAAGPVRAYDINPVPRDQVKDGGTLRWGIDEYPSQWNLNHIDGNLANVKVVIDALMPSPFRSDERADISANSDYLLDGRITHTEPRQVVRYLLNPKARWSDGTPITWADYEAQWKALSGDDADYRVAATNGYQDIQSVVRGETDHEVIVTFARPFADWQGLFSPLYPRVTNATPESFNDGWLNRIPITAGPYRFGSFDRTAKTVTLVRDPGWWGQAAKLDQIVFRGLEGDALVAAFTNGELDLFDVGASAPDNARAKAAADAVVRQAAGPDFRHITMNGESRALSDPAVRQAVAMGIDRQVIARSDLHGLDWPIELLNNHFFMNTQDGYQDNSGEIGRYDPAKAGQRLDAAGWKTVGDVRMKDGQELSLRMVFPAGGQIGKAESELVQSMLRPIGVKVVLQPVPSDDFFTKYVIPGNYDLAPFAYIGTPYPVSSAYGQYADALPGPQGRKRWNANLGRIGSPEIDRLLQQAGSELDPAAARALINEADALIWKQVNVLPLYQRPQHVAARSSLANVGARGFHDLRYADIGFTR
ncbi:ABC transporter substrate-binding protein [Microtetraspora sp. NBRC 13810]|nr:ABC transporter substrate-binding protein [Microtetraspora sp. NBRC 13810]